MKKLGKKRMLDRMSVAAYAVCYCGGSCTCYCTCNCPADVPDAKAQVRDGVSHGEKMSVLCRYNHSTLGAEYVVRQVYP